MATRMQQRRGTAAQWISTNNGNGPVLNVGEIGFETDTNKFKIGDGTNHWVDLVYFVDAESALGAVSDLVDGAPALLDTLNEIAAAIGDDPNFITTIVDEINLKQNIISGVSDAEIGYLSNVTSDIQAQIDAKANSSELAENAVDAVANALSAGDGLDKSYDDNAGTITLNIDSTVATKTYADDAVSTHNQETTNVHGIDDTAELATKTFAANLLVNATKTNIQITGDKDGITIVAENGVADSTTDNLSEGSTNKYYTDARVETKLGTSFGTGIIWDSNAAEASVDQTVIQARVADVSDTEIGYLNGVTSAIQTQIDGKQDIVSGVSSTEIGYLDGVTSAIQTQIDAKSPIASPTFTGTVTTDDLVVDGDFTVNGTNFSASATSITIEDNMVQLAHQNAANTVDLGLVVAYNDGAAKHAGIVRDVSDAKWKLFKDVSTEPSTVVAFGEGSLDDLAVGGLTASSVTVPGQQGSTTIDGNSVTTEQINVSTVVIGSTNLYDTLAAKASTADLANKLDSVTTIDAKTVDYTLVLSDKDKIIEGNYGQGGNITVPANSSQAFPIGSKVNLLQTGSGQITILADNGVTVNGTPGLKSRAQWSAVTLVKRATDTWVAFGDLTA